jgi:hypothetical protein
MVGTWAGWGGPETGLERLSFGRDDAESDVRPDKGGLLRAGFVRSAAFEAVLAGRKHVVIGRTGSGKSAICRELAAGAPRVSLVTPGDVSPGDFLQAGLQGLGVAGVAGQMLWRYVLGVQVAKYAVALTREMLGRQTPRSAEVLQKFLADNQEEADLRVHSFLSSYARRLRSVSLGAFGATVGIELGEPSDPGRPLAQVEVIERAVLAALGDLPVARGDSRLLLLVDELEQLWYGDAWSGALVSGLLLAAQHVTRTFPGVDCVVFVRSDIYDMLRFPQKDRLRGEELRISWTAEGMREVALARARASVGPYLEPGDLWGGLFPAVIDGRPTADYLISRTLGRPRDLIQLAGRCRETAAERGHPAITAADVREAEAEYSRWKRQDLEAEFQVSYPFLPEILALFQDSTYIVARGRLTEMLSGSLPWVRERYPAHAWALTLPGIIGLLYGIGFLGVRREQRVVYSHHGTARPYPNEQAFYVHPCFRPALGAVRATSAHEAESFSICLWGLPGSGKTTFLAALNTAAADSRARPLIYGIDKESEDHLAYRARSLEKHEFPAATDAESYLRFGIRLPALHRRGDGTAGPAMPGQFSFEFRDAPGGYFSAPRRFVSRADAQLAHERLFGSEAILGFTEDSDEDFTESLSLNDGFIMLIDPHRPDSAAHDYFGDLFLKIAGRCHQQNRLGDGCLPQYLAACIARFDHPDIYRLARDTGSCRVRADDPHRLPRVPDDKAKDFFATTCHAAGASTVPAAIDRHFHPDRVRYFAVSSIGFYLASETAQFNEQDYQNVAQLSGRNHIRGNIHPIDVIEPILWLGRCLTTIEE